MVIVAIVAIVAIVVKVVIIPMGRGSHSPMYEPYLGELRLNLQMQGAPCSRYINNRPTAATYPKCRPRRQCRLYLLRREPHSFTGVTQHNNRVPPCGPFFEGCRKVMERCTAHSSSYSVYSVADYSRGVARASLLWPASPRRWPTLAAPPDVWGAPPDEFWPKTYDTFTIRFRCACDISI